MITEVDPALIALRSDYKDSRKELQAAKDHILLLEQRIATLTTALDELRSDNQSLAKAKEELEQALIFKPTYA